MLASGRPCNACVLHVDPLFAVDVLVCDLDQGAGGAPCRTQPVLASAFDGQPETVEGSTEGRRDSFVVIIDEGGPHGLARGFMQPDGSGHGIRAARAAGLPDRFRGCHLETHQVVDHAVQLSFVEHVGSAHLYQSDEIVGEAGCHRSPSPAVGIEPTTN